MFYKTIVCLANSRRVGDHCIAGKELETSKWIRPISNKGDGALTTDQIKYANGEEPKLLDIIKIPFERKQPIFCQPENIVISDRKWEKISEYNTGRLDKLCDSPNDIWMKNQDYKDKIAKDFLEKNNAESSLLLIEPESIKLERITKYTRYGPKKALRALFQYKNEEYDLGVTDPFYENKYKDRDEGIYKLSHKKIFLCISLAEPHTDGYCYKLVAGVIGL